MMIIIHDDDERFLTDGRPRTARLHELERERMLNRVRDKVRGRSGVPREAMALKEAIMKRKPDVIALQEVWLKCGRAERGDEGGKWCVVVARRRRLYRSSDVFVAKARSSAGWTDREPNGGAGDTPNRARWKIREDKAFIEDMMRRAPFKNYDAHWCLAAAKRHGVGVLVKKGLKTPIRVSRTLTSDDAARRNAGRHRHE